MLSFASPFPTFFSLPHPHFHKPYLQSKTFLNRLPVSSSTVFCNNTVLVTVLRTPGSSIKFFSFFNMTSGTGMTSRLLMFHVLLISVFSSWFISIFSLFFKNSCLQVQNINYGTTSIILIHYNI